MSDDLVTIASFINTTDAYLCRMALEAEGIDSFIIDEHTASISPFHSAIIGGVRVMVRGSDAEAAAEILRRAETLEPESEEKDPVTRDEPPPRELSAPVYCPKCSSENVKHTERGPLFLLFAGMLFGLPFLLLPNMSCSMCGHKWKSR